MKEVTDIVHFSYYNHLGDHASIPISREESWYLYHAQFSNMVFEYRKSKMLDEEPYLSTCGWCLVYTNTVE